MYFEAVLIHILPSNDGKDNKTFYTILLIGYVNKKVLRFFMSLEFPYQFIWISLNCITQDGIKISY